MHTKLYVNATGPSQQKTKEFVILFVITYMLVVESCSILTPTEVAYLNNTKPFTNAQQRYIRCRLRKKLIMIGQEIERCNVALNKRVSCNASSRPNDKNGRFCAPF
ncbi:MAG: hypothetical protein M3247_01355, partial [Thermoproteota archaeon]|nr:hypothetical protein [Thermoproteota archaeon]